MSPRAWVFIAGSRWTEVHGTDANLAMAISRHAPVIWVEPPISAVDRIRTRKSIRTRSLALDSNIVGLEITTPPYPSRPVVRWAADRMFGTAIRAYLRRTNTAVEATVIANPRSRFRRLPGSTVYLVTDDWLAGAELMGLSRQWVHRNLAHNLSSADVAAAVSPVLQDRLAPFRHGRPVHVLPNACEFDEFDFGSARPLDLPPGEYGVLCGQLNERIDLRCLQESINTGTKIVVIGPVTTRDLNTRKAFEQLRSHPGVHMTGEKSRRDMVPYLVHASVGLTPYIVDEFNRASFPLKTLDYLAAALPVVSTDLPASRWLESGEVVVADSPSEFGRQVSTMSQWTTCDIDTRRAKQAQVLAAHSWSARADQLLDLVRGHV